MPNFRSFGQIFGFIKVCHRRQKYTFWGIFYPPKKLIEIVCKTSIQQMKEKILGCVAKLQISKSQKKKKKQSNFWSEISKSSNVVEQPLGGDVLPTKGNQQAS